MSSYKKKVSADNLSEEYYQISPLILEKFPKFRPPLNYYCFKENIGTLEPYFFAGKRMPKEMQEELHQLCEEGKIFVSRSDHHIYTEHISEQLDLVLLDSHLKESEVAEILNHGMYKRLELFFYQPVKSVLQILHNDILVITEYLWKDPYRIKAMLRRITPGDTLAQHCLNTLIIGLAIYLEIRVREMSRKFMDDLALGLALTELGLSKIPDFLRHKKANLTAEEQEKIHGYPLVGASLLKKMDVHSDTALQCIVQHQERLDGSGYPRELKGEDISLPGRIAAIANAYNQLFVQISLAENEETNWKKVIEALTQKENKFDPKMLKVCSKILHQAYQLDFEKEEEEESSQNGEQDN